MMMMMMFIKANIVKFIFLYEKGRREAKYLTKSRVQLRHHKTREEETDGTTTEDKNWGVEEHDVRDIIIVLCYV